MTPPIHPLRPVRRAPAMPVIDQCPLSPRHMLPDDPDFWGWFEDVRLVGRVANDNRKHTLTRAEAEDLLLG